MLVLNRKVSEKVYLNTSDGVIEVMVSQVLTRRVKLCFSAPQSVVIWRDDASMAVKPKKDRV